jgi:hypothetical protein
VKYIPLLDALLVKLVVATCHLDISKNVKTEHQIKCFTNWKGKKRKQVKINIILYNCRPGFCEAF